MTTEQLVGQLIPTVGAAGVLAGIIIGAFKWANQSIATGLRDSVALWILGEPGQGTWSLAASRVFTALYGTEYFSRRALIANLIIAAVATASAFFALLARRWPLDQVVWLALASLGVAYLLPVLFASYLKARWFARSLAQSESTVSALAMLALDLILTALLWASWIGLLLFIPPHGDNPLKAPLHFVAFVPYAFKPVLVASLLPSLLVALVVAALATRQVCIRAAPILGRASRLFNKERVEKEPLSLVGEVLAGLVFILVSAYGFLASAA